MKSVFDIRHQIAGEVLEAFPGAAGNRIDIGTLRDASVPARIDARFVGRLTAWIAYHLEALSAVGLKGCVVGLSGGIDSLICAELCRRAVGGTQPVLGVTVLVGDDEVKERQRQLPELLSFLDIEHLIADGETIDRALRGVSPVKGPWSPINTETRSVQSVLFQMADARSQAVCATRNHTEIVLGRFTEGFYGHFAPLAGLYKSEVFDLAQYLGLLREGLEFRPGCDGHWYDDEVFGVDHKVLDAVIRLLEIGMTTAQICEAYGIKHREWLERLAGRIQVQPLRINCAVFEG